MARAPQNKVGESRGELSDSLASLLFHSLAYNLSGAHSQVHTREGQEEEPGTEAQLSQWYLQKFPPVLNPLPPQLLAHLSVRAVTAAFRAAPRSVTGPPNTSFIGADMHKILRTQGTLNVFREGGHPKQGIGRDTRHCPSRKQQRASPLSVSTPSTITTKN